MLVFFHLMTAQAWAWPFTTITVPGDWWPNWPRTWAMGRFWTFPSISSYGCYHIWRHNTLHTLHGLYHALYKSLDWDISDSDCSALASKAAIFDLANCSSACASFNCGITEQWASRGNVAKEWWCRPDQYCLPMFILSFNFIHCKDNNFVHSAASIISFDLWILWQD